MEAMTGAVRRLSVGGRRHRGEVERIAGRGDPRPSFVTCCCWHRREYRAPAGHRPSALV